MKYILLVISLLFFSNIDAQFVQVNDEGEAFAQTLIKARTTFNIAKYQNNTDVEIIWVGGEFDRTLKSFWKTETVGGILKNTFIKGAKDVTISKGKVTLSDYIEALKMLGLEAEGSSIKEINENILNEIGYIPSVKITNFEVECTDFAAGTAMSFSGEIEITNGNCDRRTDVGDSFEIEGDYKIEGEGIEIYDNSFKITDKNYEIVIKGSAYKITKTGAAFADFVITQK